MVVMVTSPVCSGDEDDDEEPLDWLPIAPEIEDPEEAGWGHLEVQLLYYKLVLFIFIHRSILVSTILQSQFTYFNIYSLFLPLSLNRRISELRTVSFLK